MFQSNLQLLTTMDKLDRFDKKYQKTKGLLLKSFPLLKSKGKGEEDSFNID